MKKKLSILPIVVLALTMLFGTVCVWAEPNIYAKGIKIIMPTFCEGMNAGDFLSRMSVSVKGPDDEDYRSGKAHIIEYAQVGGCYLERISPLPNTLASTDEMINGTYKVSLVIVSDSNYMFKVADSPSIILNDRQLINPILRLGGDETAIGIEFNYTFGATPQAASTEKEAVAIIDSDLFKSEAPSKTVIVADSIGAKSFFDMKIHAADAQTQANQKLLAQNLVGGANTKIFVTENIYPRRDLSISENGSLKDLNWNNLPKNQPGPISAVVYNQIDGAYVIHGILDANGTATFTGFKLRPASTITICK